MRGKRTSAQPDGVLDEAALDLSMQRRHALIVEWNLSTHEHIEYDAEAPYVDFGAHIYFRVQQFGGGEVEGPAECGQV
jgi:hypothetical protein